MSHRELDDMLGKGWRKPAFVKNAALRWALIAGFVAYLIAAFMTIEVDWGRVYAGLDRGWAFVVAFTNPDFTSRWSDIWSGLVESIVMTVASSVVGILISIPIGLGAARNIAPLPVYVICRGIVAISTVSSRCLLRQSAICRNSWPKISKPWTRCRPRRSRRQARVGRNGSIMAYSRRLCRVWWGCRCTGSTSIFAKVLSLA